MEQQVGGSFTAALHCPLLGTNQTASHNPPSSAPPRLLPGLKSLLLDHGKLTMLQPQQLRECSRLTQLTQLHLGGPACFHTRVHHLSWVGSLTRLQDLRVRGCTKVGGPPPVRVVPACQLEQQHRPCLVNKSPCQHSSSCSRNSISHSATSRPRAHKSLVPLHCYCCPAGSPECGVLLAHAAAAAEPCPHWPCLLSSRRTSTGSLPRSWLGSHPDLTHFG